MRRAWCKRDAPSKVRCRSRLSRGCATAWLRTTAWRNMISNSVATSWALPISRCASMPSLPLVCQRTLEVYRQPVHVEQRLGLIGHESDEAALPPGYEALLIVDGQLHPAEVIEDELILALPVVPLKPGAPLDWNDGSEPDPCRPGAAQPVRGVGQAQELTPRSGQDGPLRGPDARITKRIYRSSCHGSRQESQIPVPPRHAPRPRRADRKAAADRSDVRRSAPAPPRHQGRLLPRQEGHREQGRGHAKKTERSRAAAAAHAGRTSFLDRHRRRVRQPGERWTAPRGRE